MTKHIPVLLKETIDTLSLRDGSIVVDTTFGGGGHTLELISKFINKIREGELKIIGLDHDLEAIEKFESRAKEEGLEKVGANKYKKESVEVILVNENFVKIKSVLEQLGIQEVNGVIADLGISTDQLEDERRGFSYHSQDNLDLRMDKRLGVKGYDLLNVLDKTQLIDMFRSFGDVREAKYLSENIIKRREIKKFKTIKDLLEIIDKSVRSKYSRRLYARVFQALRIVVNSEIINLKNFLPQAFDTLSHDGVLSIITFHSGEDREVKRFFKSVTEELLESPKLILPTDEEIDRNPKSSSAKLRSIIKN